MKIKPQQTQSVLHWYKLRHLIIKEPFALAILRLPGVLSIVVTDENQVSNHEKAQAVHGSIVKCRCPFGSNLVIGILPTENCYVVVI